MVANQSASSGYGREQAWSPTSKEKKLTMTLCSLLADTHSWMFTAANNTIHKAVTVEATKTHGASMLLTATALQLCISCHSLTDISLLAATCWSFIIFRFFFFFLLRTLCCLDILHFPISHLTSWRASSQLIILTHLPPSGQECELQSINMTDGPRNFLSLLIKKMSTTGNIRLRRPQAGSLKFLLSHTPLKWKKQLLFS